jgi:NitT/TauT family transport system permease protein
MPGPVFHTRRVREALAQPVALWADLILILLVGAGFGLLLLLGEQARAPYQEKVEIDLSLWALPQYALLSLGRGFAAYVLSLLFTLVYGSYAAHHPRAERIMIPALDVLQAIPVLGFLPGLVLAMIALFPTRELGLEIACIIMIFTGQVWNMTFSFHGSLKAIPQALREAVTVHHLSPWQAFRLLEVPAAMIGLIWNSMMSMAGGWFFLSVTEAFTLGNKDYRLPGIGSYMSEAIKQDQPIPMVAAMVAMALIIIIVDQLLWRPLVAWSHRFKMEDVSATDAPQSWLLDLLQKSHLNEWLRRQREHTPTFHRAVPAPLPRLLVRLRRLWRKILPVVRWVSIAAALLAVGWGLWALLSLLIALPLHDTEKGADWLHVLLALLATFLRTTGAVLLGVVWALPVGILIGRSPKWAARLQPVIQVVASFPAPMFFPLVTLFLITAGISFDLGCVVLMLLGTQWYILFNAIAGATAIPADLEQVGEVYQFSRWQRWTKLYIPCVFPYLVNGLVTAAGGAWNATIVSEYVQTPEGTFVAFGLGSIISQATAAANYPLLTAGVVTMAVAVVILNRLLWKRLYVLAEERYRLQV